MPLTGYHRTCVATTIVKNLGAQMDEWVARNELTDSEKERLRTYVNAILPVSGRKDLPDTLWHYTSAEGLLGILESGEMFASHVSCMNDSLEHLYLTKVMLKKLKARLPNSEKGVGPAL